MTTTQEPTANLYALATARRAEHPEESPERLAKLLWDEVAARPDAVDLLYPAFVTYTANALRKRVAEAERRVYNAATDELARSAVTDLLDRGFYVGARWVVWRDATPADLTERIAEYDSQIAELGEAKAVYVGALAKMTASKAKHYGDLFKVRKR